MHSSCLLDDSYACAKNQWIDSELHPTLLIIINNYSFADRPLYTICKQDADNF